MSTDTQGKPRNLKEFADSLPVKADFYREVRQRTGAAIYTIRTWCSFDSRTKDSKHLQILSEMTKIQQENLFREFDHA